MYAQVHLLGFFDHPKEALDLSPARWWPRSIQWQMLAGLLLLESLSLALFAFLITRQQAEEKRDPVLRAEQRVRRPLGMGHETKNIFFDVANAGDIKSAPIGVRGCIGFLSHWLSI